MRKKRPYWRDSNTWICPLHLPSAKLPASISRCWYSNCDSVRPPMLKFVKTGNSSKSKCAWEKCDKGPDGSKADSREKSKYCSLDCKNKNARWRYKLRKQGLLPAA